MKYKSFLLNTEHVIMRNGFSVNYNNVVFNSNGFTVLFIVNQLE